MSSREETLERLKQKAEEEGEEIEDADVEEIEEEGDLSTDETEPKRSSIREYVILQKGQGNTWGEIGRVESGSAEDAIKTLGKLQDGASYVSVPSRNWHPVQVKVEQPPPKFSFSSE